MKKIIVVSDSHSLKEILKDIAMEHQDAAALIHCGDSELHIKELEELGAYQSVRGNCDYEAFPVALDLELCGKKIHIEHGDRFYNPQNMIYYAQEIGCDIFMSGHTHVPYHEIYEGILFLNPGSLKYNRDASPCSYMILYLDEAGEQIEIEKILLKDSI